MVREGRYQPGERLVAADLAAQFDVSRAPVREALAILVGEGVVEIKKNYGARIRTFSVDELVEIMEVTAEAALVLGVRKCAERIGSASHEDVARLDQSFAQMEAAWYAHDAADFVDSIYHFHNIINAIAGNRFLEFVYQRPHFAFFNRHLAGALPVRAGRSISTVTAASTRPFARVRCMRLKRRFLLICSGR